AYRDALTGLPNRAAAMEWIQQEMDHDPTGRLVVLNLDFDRFQIIKDTFGTEISNRLLIISGRILRRRLPATTLVARLESDEFLVVQPWPASTDFPDPEELVKKLADRLQQMLNEQLPAQMPMDLHLSFSSGAVIHPLDSHSPEVLLQHANTALAKARPLGHSTHLLYSPSFSSAIERRIQLELQLEEVLQRKGLHLVYQPQVDRHGSLVGAEALVRWQQQDGTTVPPDEFIPLAESTGQIERLTAWLIETVCSQMRAWSDAGKPLNQLALNISGRHFNSDGIGLEEMLMLSTAHHGIAATSLELEVTETALLLDRKRARQQLQRLMRRGFSIALDDFGTGYSSLSILQHFPVKKLKIDKSFIQHITTSHRDRGLVESSLMIARRLGLLTLAEGVETAQQWHLLRDLGCDLYQGYLFDRGLDAESFATNWLR
ncbi:MAG: putative bifunctional diguanylate cyclase/phosphodiesterase, partial [Cyanobium sp.]